MNNISYKFRRRTKGRRVNPAKLVEGTAKYITHFLDGQSVILIAEEFSNQSHSGAQWLTLETKEQLKVLKEISKRHPPISLNNCRVFHALASDPLDMTWAAFCEFYFNKKSGFMKHLMDSKELHFIYRAFPFWLRNYKNTIGKYGGNHE